VEEEDEEEMTERLQDLLMPGLRHAHTLQQLIIVTEYSPPGEYLSNYNTKQLINKITNIKLRKSPKINK